MVGCAEAAVAENGGDPAAAGFRAQSLCAVHDIRVDVHGHHAATLPEHVCEELCVVAARSDFQHGHPPLQPELLNHVGLQPGR